MDAIGDLVRIIMTDEERDEILRTAHATVERLRRDPNEEREAILARELARPLPDFRERGSPPVRLRNHRPKIDTPHAHESIGIWEIDQRIERAVAAEREESAALLLQAIAAMNEFVDGMDNSLSKICKQMSDLGCELAELRAERAKERHVAASADGVPLLQRR
jgi:hypothetical protein